MLKNLKILLVIPVKGRHQYISFGIGYISSYLKKYGPANIEIKLADENAGDDVIKKFNEEQPDIVGITATTPQVVRAGVIATEIKKIRGKTVIIIGGIHVSTLPEQTLLDYPAIDIAVLGEGEETFREICDYWFKCGGRLVPEVLGKISGLAFRDYKGTIIKTKKRDIVLDLDKLPPPDRELFCESYYLAPRQLIRGFRAKRSTTIITSRGCPYRCKFCASNIMAQRYRAHSVEYIMKEIDVLVNKYNVEAIFFHDDLFIANKERLERFCDALIEQGYHRRIIWCCQARANFINEEAKPLLKKMKKAGCRQLEFGFESGSDRVLKFLKEVSVSVEQNQKAIDILNELDLKVFGNFMIGSVSETKKEVQLTQQFIEANLEKMNFFQVYLTVPYPGTAIWDMCKKHGLIKEGERFENFFLYNGDNISRSFSDTVSHECLEKLVQELNHLAIKKIPLSEKLQWAISQIFKDPGLVFSRLKNYFGFPVSKKNL